MKKKVAIKPGCITCGACEFIAPEIFTVTNICHVRPNIDILAHQEALHSAMQACPVQVIQYEDEPSLQTQKESYGTPVT